MDSFFCPNQRRLLSVVALMTGLLIATSSGAATKLTLNSSQPAVSQSVSIQSGNLLAALPSGMPPKTGSGIDLYIERTTCADPPARCTWERTFGSTSEDRAYGVAKMADDGLVVVGNRKLLGMNGDNAWILRLNRSGQLMWERDFGGRKNDQVYAVVATADGGMVIAGHTRSKGLGESDIWILRLDQAGKQIWERTFGGPRNDRARTLAATADGGFVVGGTTRLTDQAKDDAWLLKVDPNGRLLWYRVFGGEGADGIFNLAGRPDGGLLATGYIGLGGEAGFDLWVLQLDSLGRLNWEKRYGKGVFDAGTSIAVAPDGGSVVAGVTSTDGTSKDDAWVIRLDSEGDIIWQRVFGGSKPDAAWSVVGLPDASYAVTVATSSYGAGSADAWVICVDLDGNILWDRIYGGKQWDRPTAAIPMPDGGLIFAGYTTTQGAGYEDYWLIRLDIHGDL